MNAQAGIILIHLLSMRIKAPYATKKYLGLYAPLDQPGNEFQLTAQVIGPDGRSIWINFGVFNCGIASGVIHLLQAAGILVGLLFKLHNVTEFISGMALGKCDGWINTHTGDQLIKLLRTSNVEPDGNAVLPVKGQG